MGIRFTPESNGGLSWSVKDDANLFLNPIIQKSTYTPGSLKGRAVCALSAIYFLASYPARLLEKIAGLVYHLGLMIIKPIKWVCFIEDSLSAGELINRTFSNIGAILICPLTTIAAAVRCSIGALLHPSAAGVFTAGVSI